ncbi:MAG: ribosome recycling factor [Anaerolineae bacterium]|nr:ribosome recycling factor [Anaerolineae bacterium]
MSEEVNEILKDAEHRMKSAINALEEELSGVRTGRASPALVEKLMVEYYGTPTPLYQMASISVPEALLITIKPFDKGSLKDIEKAILNSDLRITPGNDGTIIRLPLPPLTTDRRKELVKIVNHRLEDARVAVRNVRRSAIDDVREYEKEKLISEDDSHGGQESIQKLTDKYIAQIDATGKRKEEEIMAV